MPEDLKILKDMLAGFETKGKELRVKESLFIKAQGLDEAITRNQNEKTELELELKAYKEDLKELKAEKKTAVDSVAKKICNKIDDFLPIGESFFDASDAFLLGWVYGGIKQPYNSLSGGQKSIFDAALENLLGSNILVIEGAELDKNHMQSLLADLADNKKQIFINSWFSDIKTPDEFELVEV